MTGSRDEEMSGRRADDGSWLVVEERLTGLSRMFDQRFDSLERELRQSIRHGDSTLTATMDVLSSTVKRLHKDVVSNTERISSLETQQFSWRSNLRLLIGLATFTTGAGGVAGTVIGLIIGG